MPQAIQNNGAEVSTANEFAKQASNVGVDLFAANGEIVTNDTTLRKDEQTKMDAKLVQVATTRLFAVQDLRTAGLVVPLGGLGVILSAYERVGEMTDAAINMDGVTQTEKDRLTFDQKYIPIPIIHKDWSINKRQLEASRRNGNQMDTTSIAIATRIVAERIETMLFAGVPTVIVDGNNIYGYLTHPDRNTGSLGGAWTSRTGAQIIDDVKAGIDALRADNRYGPFTLYVPSAYWTYLQLDYSTSKGENSIIDRIKKLADIKDVRWSPALTGNNIVLVELVEDVVDLAVAQDIIDIEWSTNPMVSQRKVFAAMAPRIKSDKKGQSGVYHGSV